jgi:Flp pilus assembly protein TadD
MVRCCRQKSCQKPHNAAFYAARGAYLETKRHWESAIVALKQALQLKPRDAQMLI